jgi:hypothetical protein
MPNQLVLSFPDIFHFASSNYGIHWNTANDLFFHTIFRINNVTTIYTLDLSCDISIFDGIPFKKRKASDITMEVFSTLTNREKAKLILMRYCEVKRIKRDFLVDSR